MRRNGLFTLAVIGVGTVILFLGAIFYLVFGIVLKAIF